MKTAIKSTRRIAAIVLSLALLCGVVVGTNMFVSAGETEVTKYSVDFADLVKVATDAGKDLTAPGYQATADDPTITAWVNKHFGALHSWDNSTLQTMSYLGVPYSSGARYWTITEDGLRASTKYNAHMSYGAALSLKKDDEYLQLRNFEASLVFNTDAYACGSVFISFHEPGPGNVGVYNSSFKPNGDMALAVATNDCGANTSAYLDCQGVVVGTAGNALASTTNAVIDSADRFKKDGNDTTLGQYADYKLTVKVVNGTATVTVTRVDNNTVYATKTTTVSDKVGTISIGAGVKPRVLKSIEVTELDENGNAVDLGTLAAASAENAYTVDFAKLAALVTDEQYGEGTTYQSQEADTAINDWVNERFELNYSGESHTFHDRTYLGQAISANSITAYWNIDKNGYIVNNTMSSGAEGIRSTESLTLKDKNGDLAVLDNFEATVVFKNTALHRGVVYIAFNEQTPGIFGWTGSYTSQPVLNRDAVLVGIMEDRVSDSGISVKGYGDAISDSLYGFNETFTNKLTAGDTAVEHQLYIKVIGNDLYVKVTTPSTGVVNWEKTYVDAVKGTSGTVSIGAGRGARAIKSISVTELDETGVPVDFGTNNFESAQPQSFSADFADLAAKVDSASYTDGLYTPVTSDAANAWLSERFDGYYNKECRVFLTRTEFGNVLTASETNSHWEVDQDGYLVHPHDYNGVEYIRFTESLFLKKDGKQLQWSNFEAKVVFNTCTVNTRGGVFLTFHDNSGGQFKWNDSTTAASQQNMVIVATPEEKTVNGIGIKNYNGTIDACAGSEFTYFTTPLVSDTDYELYVKVVNGLMTVKVLGTGDDTTEYYTNTVSVGDRTGAISVGASHVTRAIKSIDVVTLDVNGDVITDAALIGNDGVVDLAIADGYEVKAGSLIVTDANGNKFVPQRVGFQNGGNAAQYQVIDKTAVAPFTVDYEVIEPSLENPNIGNIGNSYNSNLVGLRFVSRFSRTVDDNESWLLGNYEIVDYGMLAASAPGIAANTGMTAEEAMTLDATLAPAGQYVQKLSIKDANKYYDLCDEHADMALTFINIDAVTGYGNARDIEFYARPYVVVQNGDAQTVLYGAYFSSSLADVAPAAQ